MIKSRTEAPHLPLSSFAFSVTISWALPSFHLIPACLHRFCTTLLFPLSTSPDPRKLFIGFIGLILKSAIHVVMQEKELYREMAMDERTYPES
jgi:hypothetical protein